MHCTHNAIKHDYLKNKLKYCEWLLKQKHIGHHWLTTSDLTTGLSLKVCKLSFKNQFLYVEKMKEVLLQGSSSAQQFSLVEALR